MPPLYLSILYPVNRHVTAASIFKLCIKRTLILSGPFRLSWNKCHKKRSESVK